MILAADTARRVLMSRIEVLDERPEDRSGFKHADILRHVEANQPRLFRAALLWLAAFLRQRRASECLPPFGSFEGWSDVIRGAIVWAGLSDPCEDRALISDSSDRSKEELAAVLDGLALYDPADRGFTSSGVMQDLYPTGGGLNPEWADLRLALEAVAGTRPGIPPTSRKVGAYFRANRKRVVKGLYLDSEKKSSKGKLWCVRRPEGHAGSCGVSPSRHRVDDSGDCDDSTQSPSASEHDIGQDGVLRPALACVTTAAGLESQESSESAATSFRHGDTPHLVTPPPSC